MAQDQPVGLILSHPTPPASSGVGPLLHRCAVGGASDSIGLENVGAEPLERYRVIAPVRGIV